LGELRKAEKTAIGSKKERSSVIMALGDWV
jgi:hypothetical protein